MKSLLTILISISASVLLNQTLAQTITFDDQGWTNAEAVAADMAAGINGYIFTLSNPAGVDHDIFYDDNDGEGGTGSVFGGLDDQQVLTITKSDGGDFILDAFYWAGGAFGSFTDGILMEVYSDGNSEVDFQIFKSSLTVPVTVNTSLTTGDELRITGIGSIENDFSFAFDNLVFLDGDGSVSASSAVVEPVDLNPTIDTVGEAVDLFDFTISDGGSNDGLALTASQIGVLVGGTSSDTDRAKITWRLNGPDASNVVGTYNASSDVIIFSGLNVSVADGDNETYTVNAYFNDNTGLTGGSTVFLSVDGSRFWTLGGSSTQIHDTPTISNSTGTTITIEATSLAFTTQPAGAVSGNVLSTPPVVVAQDALGNIDTDFTETVTLSTTAPGTLTGNSVAAVAGIATFSALTYTATADQQAFTLVANDEDGTGSDFATIDSDSVTADVVATKLLFTTQPAPLSFSESTATDLSTDPVVQAVDANNILDSDYSTDVLLSAANNAGTVALSASGDTDADAATVTLPAVSGQTGFTDLTVTYNLSADSDETFNLRASSGALTTADSSQLTAQATNDPPTLSATAVSPTYVEGAAAVDLFETVTVSTVESGQTIAGLELTVSNVTEGTEELIGVDGSEIALNNGASATSADNGLSLNVVEAAGTATLTISSATLTVADAQTLVDELSYRNSSDNPTTTLARVVTLTSLSDSGSNTAPSNNTTALAIASTINITAVNDPPSLSAVFGESAEIEVGGQAQAVSLLADAVLSNPDSPNYDGGTLNIALTSGTANGSWSFTGSSVSAGGDAAVAAGETVSVSGTSIGTVDASHDGQGGNNLLIALNADATDARLQTLLRALAFAVPEALGNRDFTLALNDADGTANGGTEETTGSFTINVLVNEEDVEEAEEEQTSNTDEDEDANNGSQPDSTIEGEFSGGALEGNIENNGQISDTVFLPDSVVTGGTLGGNISGSGGGQVSIRGASLLPGTRLENAVIGADVALTGDVELGQGVRFESIDNIPFDAELGGALPGIPNSAGIVALDLSETVLSPGGSDQPESLLEDLRLDPAFSELGLEIEQDPSSGELLISTGDSLSRLVPTSLRRAPADSSPGTSINRDGGVLLTTASGLEITAQVAVADEQLLRDAVPDFAVQIEGDGTLEFTNGNDADGIRFVARPALEIRQSTGDNASMLTLIESELLPGVPLAELTLSSGEKQILYPTPANWDALAEALESLTGLEGLSLGLDGSIRFSQDGVEIGALPDYAVLAAEEPANDAGPLTFELAGDANGDGLEDVAVTYPNGERQIFYALP